MHDLAFADSARPTPVQILKLPLMPYSVGHEILLVQKRNPFLALSYKEFTELSSVDQCIALGEAVWICCQTWRQNHGHSRLKHLLWSRRLAKGLNYPEEIAKFWLYLVNSRALLPSPDAEVDKICNGESSGRELGAPLTAQLLNFLASRPAVAGETIFDTPFSFAANLYFSQLESEGNYRILNRRETECRENLDKIKAEIEAEEAASGDSEPITEPGMATPPPDLG